MRLVDCDVIIKFLDDFADSCGNHQKAVLREVKYALGHFPTIDAEPIKHGRWENKYDNGNWHCSMCGAIVEKDEQNRHNWNRCYHCGAKMDLNDTYSTGHNENETR